MKESYLAQYRAVQDVAKAVLDALGPTLRPEDTERTIAQRAASQMALRGITETWYYGCPAFVLLGSRSCLSISGREYIPADEPLGQFNLVTVDLSPSKNGIWGDCARSYCFEEGHWVKVPTDAEFQAGLATEGRLHEVIRKNARATMTFEDLFRLANDEIVVAGFENLDFRGNVGHSIESERANRRFISYRNSQKLTELRFFTFEPHIRKVGGRWGFKHENIYFFSKNGFLEEL